jgi:hypothetical protein
MNNDNHDIIISDIWSFEQALFLEDKVSEIHVRELFHCIEDVIIEKGKPFLSTKDYDEGSEDYKRTFISHINDFRDTLGDYQARYTLNYFFTNEYAYYYSQSIMVDNSYDNFDFWFTCKLRQFDTKLITLNEFLDFQLKSNFNKDFFNYLRFLNAIVTQYKKELLNVRLIEGVNQWINEYKSDSDIRDQRKLKGEYSSLRLRELSSNTNYFQENSQTLNAVLKQLRDNDFIHDDTLFINFKRIFKESNIPEDKRIVWTGTNKDLQWFMKYLTKESNKIKYHKDDIWLVASKCFVDKEGKEFAADSLRKANGDNWQRKKLLESILAKI